MENLRSTIKKIFKDAFKSFKRFPASILSALIISVIAVVRISMEWETSKTYNLLFDSLQLSFILGAVFTMATVAYIEVKNKKGNQSFILANICGIALSIVSFLFLYFYGGKTSGAGNVNLSLIAGARISVAIYITIVCYIYITSKAKSINSFSDAFFISHRAFIISFIYGLVTMIGISGVLGAFQALVYRNMDYRIYQYLGVIVGFLTYTIFLGYFPSFIAGEDEDKIKEVKEQPRFIYVLLEYILIPIMISLTVVLLIWSMRVLSKGIDVSFNQLSSIASTYVIIGIWLHIMVSSHQTKLAKFYKTVYPFAGILILIFEAFALFVQINKFGFKTAEYSFLMIWIFALISILLLIFLKNKSYRKIALAAIVISIIWVLPIVGYRDITFNSQVNRLEEILTNQGMLVDDAIVSSEKEVEYEKRGQITEAVNFIANSEKENFPKWFQKDLRNSYVFKDTFGFDKTYVRDREATEYSSANFRIKTEAIDISDYSLSLNMTGNEERDMIYTFKDGNDIYKINLNNPPNATPKVEVKLNDYIIMEKDMRQYLNDLLDKYPIEENREFEVPFEDMHFILERQDVSILFVFNDIDIYFDDVRNTKDYFVNLYGIYVKYK
ncbi:MAG: hypothetical protein ACTHW2_06075 [Tissierella sp.]|uniref:hypothetical protein n=1 Tax=Tissierella sp. TaxID=41274 RepID=UPI003F9BA027